MRFRLKSYISTLIVVTTWVFATTPTFAGRLDIHLSRAAEHASVANARKLSRSGMISFKIKQISGSKELFTSVILQAKASALPALLAMGVTIHSVLPNGIVTADVPVKRLRAVAARSDVGLIEAGQRVRKYNDISNNYKVDETGSINWGLNNSRSHNGAGVIVGVVDSGLDWTHGDFIDDDTGESRILYYWDQSDKDDDQTPSGSDWSFSYGHEYTLADFNFALGSFDHSWDPTTNSFAPVDDPNYPIKAAARDNDGHGTHVTGTAAGDGSASGYQGVAPAADIIFVKFDFEGDRNNDTAIIDAINYIFKRAGELGKPAVINLSLGSDYGPHDGSTLEERGIDALIGPGQVVVAAAGNPGTNNWSAPLSWGFAMHGSGTMGMDPVTFRFPTYTATDSAYVFLDIWYGGSESCRVRVTSPSGNVYPPSFKGKHRNTWKTGSPDTGFNTSEGGILVTNGGDGLDWSTDNNDHELYVEISDYWGVAPATGTWTIEIIPLSTPEGGNYHAWYGAGSDVVKGWQVELPPRDTTPKFGGRESDNIMTIGKPATADRVIAVAAYSSRLEWYYYDPISDSQSTNPQRYADTPIGYYDPYAIGELAYFSARGPRRDGMLKPEIATPGVGIASAFSHFTRHLEWQDRAVAFSNGGPYHFSTNRVLPNLEGGILQGTSMASPNCAGAVALMIEADHTLDDNGLRDLFANTARHDNATDIYASSANSAETDTDTSGTGTMQPNNDWGHGKLDVDNGLAYLLNDQPLICVDVDKNGNINIDDVFCLFQYNMGRPSCMDEIDLSQHLCADIDQDGDVDIDDVYCLFRHAMGRSSCMDDV